MSENREARHAEPSNVLELVLPLELSLVYRCCCCLKDQWKLRGKAYGQASQLHSENGPRLLSFEPLQGILRSKYAMILGVETLSLSLSLYLSLSLSLSIYIYIYTHMCYDMKNEYYTCTYIYIYIYTLTLKFELFKSSDRNYSTKRCP